MVARVLIKGKIGGSYFVGSADSEINRAPPSAYVECQASWLKTSVLLSQLGQGVSELADGGNRGEKTSGKGKIPEVGQPG